MPTISPPESPQEAINALIARVADVQRTQQQEDVPGFLSLFDPSAVRVTSGGRRLIGLDAISNFTRSVLPGAMSDGSVTYSVEHILFISVDVVLTAVQQQYVDRDGNPTSAGRPSYVWRKTGGVWRIIAGQNTAVEE
jgi:uncharacterized protein (TIGR02246 family)